MKILFISAEAAPFAKTGGLGDVAGSLPIALRQMGHDVRVAIPAYSNIEAGHPDVEAMDRPLFVPMGGGEVRSGVFHSTLPDSDVPVYFIGEWHLFNRDRIYGYSDDAYRFAFFSRAALHLSVYLDWRPDVIHAHDWHTAPAVTWLATSGQAQDQYRGIPSIFTIHNLAHQGSTAWSVFDYLGVVTHGLQEENYGEVNFMARGIYHATLVNTVSPSYALEIRTREGGAGMDGLLRHRQADLHGILNGLDYDLWDPATDASVAKNYTADTLHERLENRRDLQRAANLPQRDNIPLVAMVSRLDWQKGLDITGHVIHLLMNGLAGDAQFIVLGTGEPHYENMFADIANYHRDKMTAFLKYDAALARKIYAGSDIFLMPSLFEPCGLGQLISMRYGTVPVVRATGGLIDTVQDGITGFTFYDYNADAFWQALQRAIYIYNVDKESWYSIQRNGMLSEYSWQRSAKGYQQLYEWAIARLRG